MNVLIGPYTNDDTARKIEIRIDPFDTWSADHTLALIIVPILKQLKATKHGAPMVDNEDVPEHLRSTSAPSTIDHVDANHFLRWDWVMDEMIWAMEQIVKDDESEFYDNSEVDENADFNTQLSQMKLDRQGIQQYHERLQHGCQLFGKYFTALWD